MTCLLLVLLAGAPTPDFKFHDRRQEKQLVRELPGCWECSYKYQYCRITFYTDGTCQNDFNGWNWKGTWRVRGMVITVDEIQPELKLKNRWSVQIDSLQPGAISGYGFRIKRRLIPY